MQSTIYSTISRADLKLLFGLGEDVLHKWIEEGMPSGDDGRFSLIAVCRWMKNRQKHIERRKINLSNITVNQLVRLTGKSRQTIHDWHVKYGLPRNSDNKTHSLSAVMKWLPGFYDRVYKARHQRIAQKMSQTISEINSKRLIRKMSNTL